jgi:HAD superfamily hydrolase (TIGR01509 family)
MRVADTELEEWVQLEKQAVTERLSRVLRPRADVQRAVETLARRYRLAVVSSSATSRLDACFTATGLDEFFPLELRFSAEDSLDPPVSKPDPAVYRHAIRRIGCPPDEALAVEDSVSGVEAAVGAGLRTLGTVEFAPEGERRRLRERLRSAGALAVAGTFAELASWL